MDKRRPRGKTPLQLTRVCMMTSDLTSVNALMGARVIGGKRLPHKIGKIKEFVFHPSKKRVVGFILKRSDFLWMFKRKDRYVAINGYIVIEGRFFIRPERKSSGRAALKAWGLDLDDCTWWIGLPIVAQNGKTFGTVEDVVFAHYTGKINHIKSGSGTIGSALYDRRNIPVDMVVGYCGKTAMASEIEGGENLKGEEYAYGAILVSNKTSKLPVEEGLASKAGRGASVVAEKAGQIGSKASITARAAATVAGTIITDGAVATGKQLKKTKGMFSAFRDEYRKARHD